MHLGRSVSVATGTPKVALLGVPYDASSSYQRGSAGAPVVIREALWSEAANTWTETGLDLRESGLDDDGDLWFSDREPGERGPGADRGGGALGRSTPAGARCLLGGDHSITYPVLPRPPAALSSARDPAPRRAPRPVRRVRGRPLLPRLSVRPNPGGRTGRSPGAGRHPDHDRPPAGAGPDGWGGGDRDDGAGVRERRSASTRRSTSRFDLDVLEPGLVPGVSHREPGGLSVRQASPSSSRSRRRSSVPTSWSSTRPTTRAALTAAVAAKLVKEIAAHMLTETR